MAQDYTQAISEISTALTIMSQAPDKTWVSALAIIFSGLVGFFAAMITIRMQKNREEKNNEQRRVLVLSLINEEISHRWKNEIEPHLNSILAKPSNEAFIEFSHMTLKREDVHVLKSISDDFTRFYFLKHSLVSDLVHRYLQFCDLIDGKNKLLELHSTIIERRDDLQKSHNTEDTDRHIAEEYGENIGSHIDDVKEKLMVTTSNDSIYCLSNHSCV